MVLRRAVSARTALPKNAFLSFCTKANKTPVSPRPSASVLLIAPLGGSDDGYQVMLTKRNEALKFAPGFHAFPGGAVDRAEHALCKSEFLEDQYATYKLTAFREVFEESGLRLDFIKHAEKGNAHDAAIKDLQGKAEESADAFWTEIANSSDALKVEWKPWARFVTPQSYPARFDTIFFLTILPCPSNEYTLSTPPSEELVSHDWMTPSEAIEAHAKNDLKFMPPQWFMLKELTGLPLVRDIVASKRGLVPVEPFCYPEGIHPAKAEEMVHVLPGDEHHPLHAGQAGWVNKMVIKGKGFRDIQRTCTIPEDKRSDWGAW